MAEFEEKLLKDYFEEMTKVAETVPGLKLDTAIRDGIRKGRIKARDFRKGYAAAVLAVIAVVLFVFVPWAYEQIKPEQAVRTPKSWGELEVYRQAIGDNLTVTSALDAGFVQQVNIVSPEVAGFQMTVNGVIADRRGVILLYALNNRTGQDYMNNRITFTRNNSSLTALTAETYGFSSKMNYRPEDAKLGIVRDIMLIPWENLQEALPDQVYATLTLVPKDDQQQLIHINGEMQMYKLKVLIDLEAAEYSQGSSLDLKGDLSVAGQTIRMNNVYIGPTGIYMNESYEGNNTMKIYRDYGLKMVMGTGVHEKELAQTAGFSINGSPFYYIFDNDNMRPRDPIRLDLEGLYAIEKSKLEVVINTETREILKGPDERLSLSERMDNAKAGELILDLSMPLSGDESFPEGGNFDLDPNFVDGEGAGHWLVQPEGGVRVENKEYRKKGTENITTAIYNIGTEKLPQPLTFKLSYYPGLIIEPDSLRIR